MAKKKGGKSKGAVSAGIHSNVSTATKKLVKSGYKQSGQRVLNQLNAHLAGKKVMITIPNPNKEQTNKPFIRVPSTQIWKDPKNNSYMMR